MKTYQLFINGQYVLTPPNGESGSIPTIPIAQALGEDPARFCRRCRDRAVKAATRPCGVAPGRR